MGAAEDRKREPKAEGGEVFVEDVVIAWEGSISWNVVNGF